MIGLVSSMYDDVSVNGCASVAKLAEASRKTLHSMAGCSALVDSLLNVLAERRGPLSTEDSRLPFGTGVDADTALPEALYAPSYSLDTRTNAALALALLTRVPQGQQNVLAYTCSGGVAGGALHELCRYALQPIKVGSDAHASHAATREYEVAYLQAYW